MNLAVLTGRLTRDPELTFIPSTGLAVCKMNLAVDKDLYGEKKQQAISQGKPTADFINVTVFGKSAENCANYLAKGSKCAIHGRINTGSYTTQSGEKRYTTDVIADKVEFLDSKKETSNIPSDDEDVFEPVDNDEEIPF